MNIYFLTAPLTDSKNFIILTVAVRGAVHFIDVPWSFAEGELGDGPKQDAACSKIKSGILAGSKPVPVKTDRF